MVKRQSLVVPWKKEEEKDMSVILETSKGDIVLDLFVDECPKTVQNFLKYVYGPVESVEGIFLCTFVATF